MYIDNRKILIVITVINLLLFPIVIFTSGPLRTALGLPFVLFFPGYTLLSALFPKQKDFNCTTRMALSFALSIAIVPLIGLILNYTLFGIRLYPILISISLFIIATAAIGWYRQQKLPETDRLHFSLSVHLLQWTSINKLNKSLYIFLIVAVLVAIGSLSYVISTPKQGEKFTEFYLLGLSGKAEGYPQEAIAGQPVSLILGVVNQEQETTSYQVEIKAGGETIGRITTGSLENDQKWEEVINFTLRTPSQKQRVEFYLYKNGETEPCFKDPLHLYIDVY